MRNKIYEQTHGQSMCSSRYTINKPGASISGQPYNKDLQKIIQQLKIPINECMFSLKRLIIDQIDSTNI